MTEERLLAFMRDAYGFAKFSRDRSTQNGAVIIDPSSGSIQSAGFNNIATCSQHIAERFERPLKYQWTEHAERAAVCSAAKAGIACGGMWMICCWAACPDCARAIAMAGISTLVRHSTTFHATSRQWVEAVRVGDEILKESGVEVINVSGKIGVSILFDGKTVEV